MRKIIPSLGKYDTSAVLLMLLLQLISLSLIVMLRGISVSVVALLHCSRW